MTSYVSNIKNPQKIIKNPSSISTVNENTESSLASLKWRSVEMHYIQRKKQSVPQSLPQWLKEEPPQIKWKETSNYSQTIPVFSLFHLSNSFPKIWFFSLEGQPKLQPIYIGLESHPLKQSSHGLNPCGRSPTGGGHLRLTALRCLRENMRVFWSWIFAKSTNSF